MLTIPLSEPFWLEVRMEVAFFLLFYFILWTSSITLRRRSYIKRELGSFELEKERGRVIEWIFFRVGAVKQLLPFQQLKLTLLQEKSARSLVRSVSSFIRYSFVGKKGFHPKVRDFHKSLFYRFLLILENQLCNYRAGAQIIEVYARTSWLKNTVRVKAE